MITIQLNGTLQFQQSEAFEAFVQPRDSLIE